MNYVYDRGGQVTAVYGIKVGDHLGSTNVISDYEGKLYEHLEYTPYGETFVDEAPNATEHVNYKFTGKEYDPESLLYYFGARYHDALFSRWISPDPGEEGLNWYEFSSSNPINYHDPDGNAAETVWDVVNIGMGVYSFVDNVKRGDALGATVDAVGIIADTGAALLPFVPGGAGTAIRAVRVAQKAEKIGNAIVAARDVKEGVESGNVGKVVLGAVSFGSNVQNSRLKISNQTIKFKRWKLGDAIDKPLPDGINPSWDVVRKRYWKNRANSSQGTGEFDKDTLNEMRKGNAPMDYNPRTGKYEPRELHHWNPRRMGGAAVNNPRNLREVTPDQHAEMDPCRHVK